jgi:DNA-binding response OmpR family regulator
MDDERKTAVVIDDESNIRELVSLYLREDNFEVFLASSGEEGLALIRKQNPDLIVTDIHMGEVNGMDVIRAIKDEGKQAKIIVMSAKFVDGETNFIQEAGKLGVDEVIAKPIIDTILRLKVERAFSS